MRCRMIHRAGDRCIRGRTMEHDQVPLMSVMVSIIKEAGKPSRLALTAYGRFPEALTSLVEDFSKAGFTFGTITEDGDMLKVIGTLPCEDGEDGRQAARDLTAWWKRYCHADSGSGNGERTWYA